MGKFSAENFAYKYTIIDPIFASTKKIYKTLILSISSSFITSFSWWIPVECFTLEEQLLRISVHRFLIAIKDLHLSINVKLLKVNTLNYELNIIFRMDPAEGFIFFKIKFTFSLHLCAKNPSLSSKLGLVCNPQFQLEGS